MKQSSFPHAPSRLFAALLFILSAAAAAAGPAPIVIINVNEPGVGFNDPTPAAAIGGNTGTTLGEQRLIAFAHAAHLWSAQLDSTVPIRIRAQFTPLGAGILGSAGPVQVISDFPNAPVPGTWYAIALANKLAGFDLIPDGPSSDDINANFSSTFDFYLGLDGNHGARNDLVVVLLHELAHGLGFGQFASLTTGALLGGLPDAYNSQLFDTAEQLLWSQMTDAQRLASATRFGRVVWNGSQVLADVPAVLSLGSPVVQIASPPAIAGSYQYGRATFGPTIGSPTVTAGVVAAVDAVEAGGTSTDGCSPFANAGAIVGKIALVERGPCSFAQAARNATVAGAAAIVIYNQAANLNAAPPGMGDDGINGAFVSIPAVSLRRADGLAIVAQLGSGVIATIGLDLTIRAGADGSGRARLSSPFPIVSGSSVSHYDSVASRNLLMEPSINPDLTHALRAPFDLTYELLRDIGWYPDADGDLVSDDVDCDARSDLRPTIVIGAIDTGVRNLFFVNGCTSADLIAKLAAAGENHGAFVSGVAQLTNGWAADALITGNQKGDIQSAAAKFNGN
jgi:hypothetical protein